MWPSVRKNATQTDRDIVDVIRYVRRTYHYCNRSSTPCWMCSHIVLTSKQQYLEAIARLSSRKQMSTELICEGNLPYGNAITWIAEHAPHVLPMLSWNFNFDIPSVHTYGLRYWKERTRQQHVTILTLHKMSKLPFSVICHILKFL